MENGKVILPAAQPVSSGASGVSAPFSILPEKAARPAEALGRDMSQSLTAPAGKHREAAATGFKFEDVPQLFGQICLDASGPAHSMTVAAGEALRKSIEQTMRFMEDLAGAKGPSDAIRLQLGFCTAQLQLFAESSKAIQKEFIKVFMASASWHKAAEGSSEPR